MGQRKSGRTRKDSIAFELELLTNRAVALASVSRTCKDLDGKRVCQSCEGLFRKFGSLKSHSIRHERCDRMNVVFACLLWLALPCSGERQLDAGEPCMVTVDTGASSAEWNKYALAVVADLECADLMNPSDLERLTEDPYYRVNNAEGFRGDTGTARFFDATGQLRSLRFWTVSSPEVFTEFIEFLLEKRGDTAQVSGTNLQKRITVPPPPVVAGKPHTTWVDVFVSYSNGLIALGGSDAIFSFDSAALSTLLQQHEGKDWQLHLLPGAVPEEVRNAFLTEVLLQTGVGLQRRDNEATDDYSTRRLLIEASAITLRSSLLDLKRLSAWTSWPKDNQPFKSRVEILAKPDTLLSTAFKSLSKNPPTIELSPGTTTVGSIALHISIPDRLQIPLNAFLEGLQTERPELSQLLTAVSNGQIEAVAELHEPEEGVPVFSGGIRLNDTYPTDEIVARAIGANIDSASTIFRTLETGYAGKSFQSQHLALRMNDGILRFAISRNGVPVTDDQVKFRAGTGNSGQLIQLNFDFARWAARAKDSEVSLFIAELESAFQRWQVFQTTGEYLSMRHREHLVGNGFRSLAGKITRDGEWKINLSVRSSTDSVTLNCEVGRDLHRFALAHHLAARAEASRLRKPISSHR